MLLGSVATASFSGYHQTGTYSRAACFRADHRYDAGNLHAKSAEEVADTALFGGIEEREKAVLADCARCALLDLCYSGCMFHSLKDSRVIAEKDYYCAGYKLYFEHMLRRVHSDLFQCDRAQSRIRGVVQVDARGFLAEPGEDEGHDDAGRGDDRDQKTPPISLRIMAATSGAGAENTS